MKRILVTGEHSYIGNALRCYVDRYGLEEQFSLQYISVRGRDWKDISFQGFDAVVHLAAIVHQNEGSIDAKQYYEINTDLAVELAQKAKSDGVHQFVFFSTMSVYGLNRGIIRNDTVPKPITLYGKSKLLAENSILDLQDSSFIVSVLRPPMVYGPKCNGNFDKLIKIVKKTPVFPAIHNQRSMIYIESLVRFTLDVVAEGRKGLFQPQDSHNMCTTTMAQWIADSMKKKLHVSVLLGICVRLIMPFSKTVSKAFGSLIYDIDENRVDTDIQTAVKNSCDSIVN